MQMRNVLFLILLLNFLAFIYQSWIIEPDEKVEAFYIEQEYPGLVAAEIKWEPEPAKDVPVVESIKVPEMLCLRIGPFAREADAESVGAALEARDGEVRQSSKLGQVWVGHWVQVVDQPSRAAAERARDALKVGGIPDAYVLPGDDYRISLGVFRLRSSANRVVQEAKESGFQTRVDDRFQAGTNFWLQVRMAGDMSRQLGELRTESGQILRTEALSCQDAGF
jgi:hypothetical protein